VNITDLGWNWHRESVREDPDTYSGSFMIGTVYNYYKVVLFITEDKTKGIFITFK
jgi:hypothetical protein